MVHVDESMKLAAPDPAGSQIDDGSTDRYLDQAELKCAIEIALHKNKAGKTGQAVPRKIE